MRSRAFIPEVALRWLCLLTAIANIGGNLGMVAAYRPIFAWAKIPLPLDVHLFMIECALSFTMGVVALLIFVKPDRGLLAAGALGKGLYASVTYAFFAIGAVHPLFLFFVVWDALYVVIFLLYWVRLAGADILDLQIDVFEGIKNPKRKSLKRALLVGFSRTGNGKKALDRLEKGLRRGGYEVDRTDVAAQEPLFTFPLSFLRFVRIIARAFVRIPAKVAPLKVPDGIDWDLVIVESPTWLLGMAAPIESIFLDPVNRPIFEGRDAAALVVSRGAYQRTLAMIVRHLERAGANVVAGRGFAHQGWEPRRLMSLWFYLIFNREGFPPLLAEPHYGLDGVTLDKVETLGQSLAERRRTRPHWTLLLGQTGAVDA